MDKAVDFVMDSLARWVDPSSASVASDVTYEIPYRAVREAVVNAVAHRNYASKAAVQVMVFADRVEVWSPGGLPEELSVDQLRKPHHSVPRNRLLCEPLFLAHYIERAGTGTLDMIRLCVEAGLPEPEFYHEGERFVVVLRRDWLTDDLMTRLGLNERQRKAAAFLRREGRITNAEYQELTGAVSRTALRDQRELMDRGVVEKVGTTGRATHYVLRRKPDINPPNPT